MKHLARLTRDELEHLALRLLADCDQSRAAEADAKEQTIRSLESAERALRQALDSRRECTSAVRAATAAIEELMRIDGENRSLRAQLRRARRRGRR